MVQQGTDAIALEKIFQPGSGLVHAHDRKQGHLRAKCCRIVCNVCRTARSLIFLLSVNSYDWYRRLSEERPVDPIASIGAAR